MNDPLPISSETGLRFLEGKSFEEVTVWLDRALHGQEHLPSVIPGESPEGPILRRERSLSEIPRQDLRNACRALAKRFVKFPEDDSDYLAALLQLAQGFNLKDLVTDLHKLASEAEVFSTLPERQIKSILFALLDLRAPLPLDFWKDIATSLPKTLSVIAISGLLTHGYESAMQVLPSLPDDEAVADSLFVILDQHAQLLNPNEVAKMALNVRQVLDNCSLQIRTSLEEWLREHDAHPVRDATANFSSRSKLDSALAALAARDGQTYSPRPTSARLRPVSAPVGRAA